MSSFVRACAVAELPRDGVRRAQIDGEPVVIVRAEGAFYALSDVCSHDEVALSDGELEGSTLECWLHGARFDVRTGRPLCLPATEPVPVYQVKIEGDDVYVSSSPSDISASSEISAPSAAVSTSQESFR